MFAVIFKARVKKFDNEYSKTARDLRDLAFSKYNCQDFISATEGDQEIAISYWLSQQDIQDWHQDPKHQAAQEIGRMRWYSAYTVEVSELKKSYQNSLL